MSVPGGLMGVQDRLLPPAIPFRFFGTASLFLTFAWGLLFLSGGELIDYAGGPGFVLAAIHSLTLGVLTMTAMGASLQLLPVATRQAFGNLYLCRMLWALHSVATVFLGIGMAIADVNLMALGGGLAFLSLCLFGWLLSGNLRQGSGMTVVILHCWSAFAGLIILTILGIALASNPTTGWIEDVATAANPFPHRQLWFHGPLCRRLQLYPDPDVCPVVGAEKQTGVSLADHLWPWPWRRHWRAAFRNAGLTLVRRGYRPFWYRGTSALDAVGFEVGNAEEAGPPFHTDPLRLVALADRHNLGPIHLCWWLRRGKCLGNFWVPGPGLAT